MVEISLSGSGEGPGWVTAPGYSTAAFGPAIRVWIVCEVPIGTHSTMPSENRNTKQRFPYHRY